MVKPRNLSRADVAHVPDEVEAKLPVLSIVEHVQMADAMNCEPVLMLPNVEAPHETDPDMVINVVNAVAPSVLMPKAEADIAFTVIIAAFVTQTPDKAASSLTLVVRLALVLQTPVVDTNRRRSPRRSYR